MLPPNILSSLKVAILREVHQIQGFMQLLMKPRNGMPWSAEDKLALHLHLKRVAQTLPILGLFSLPGGSLLLPLLALFLDRRRQRNRKTIPAAATHSHGNGAPARELNRTEVRH